MQSFFIVPYFFYKLEIRIKNLSLKDFYYILLLDPNTSFILCDTVSFTNSLAGVKYFLGSNAFGSSFNTFLIPAVKANLKSVSTLIFDTPDLLASFNISLVHLLLLEYFLHIHYTFLLIQV